MQPLCVCDCPFLLSDCACSAEPSIRIKCRLGLREAYPRKHHSDDTASSFCCASSASAQLAARLDCSCTELHILSLSTSASLSLSLLHCCTHIKAPARCLTCPAASNRPVNISVRPTVSHKSQRCSGGCRRRRPPRGVQICGAPGDGQPAADAPAEPARQQPQPHSHCVPNRPPLSRPPRRASLAPWSRPSGAFLRSWVPSQVSWAAG